MKLCDMVRKVTVGKGKKREIAEVEFNRFKLKRVIEYGLEEQKREENK